MSSQSPHCTGTIFGPRLSHSQVGKKSLHDDVIKWKHFPLYWPFVWGIHRSRWIPRTKASDAELSCFSLICARINYWVNNREARDLRCHRGHYDVNVMHIGHPSGHATSFRRNIDVIIASYVRWDSQTLVPEAGISGGISNCIPQYSVRCNYLSLPEIHASGIKVLNSPDIFSFLFLLSHRNSFNI